jgi:5-methylcytosine-specific restriction endonuclease McrA
MASVSQNGRRKARPWTAQDQIVAEVAAACGVGLREIGRVLDRPHNAISRHLDPIIAKKQRKFHQQYYQANLESQRERNRNSYRANAEQRRDYARNYRKVNADQVRESKRRYSAANFEMERKRRRFYYLANAEELRAKSRVNSRLWYIANPGKHREKMRRRNAWQRAARRRALSPVTRAQIDARFALWNNCCAFCGADAVHERNHGRERLTVEHVLALTKGGLDEASNIIPACTACNSSKHNSPVEDWYRRQPWFTEARWAKIRKHCPAAVVGQLPLALAAGPSLP